MQKTPSATIKDTKAVNIVCRYFVKATLAVVYLIVNGGGKRYLVTLNANGTTGCIDAETNEQCEGCKHGHDCYHKLAVIEVEGLRGLHMQEHGTLAGFRFVAPVAKKERKPRSFNFEAPTDTLAMRALVATFHKTASIAKAEALGNLFAGMADGDGMITIHHMQWYYDRDIKSIFERVQVASNVSEVAEEMSSKCPVVVSPEQYQEEQHAAAPEDVVSGVIPVEEDPFAVVEELPLEEEFTEDKAEAWALEALEEAERAIEERPKEPTRAQVIAAIRAGVDQLVDFDPDYASKDNGIGPNGTDTIFMHAFSKRMLRGDEPIPAKKWLAAAKKLQKYNRTQLGGIVPPMAIVEKVLGGGSTESQRNAAPLNRNQGFSLMK